MTAPITAYIDFASPYSYFLLEPLKAEADRHGRRLVLRPILLWAVLKEHGLTNPLETPLRRAYFMQDVVRSAAFFGKTFHPPEPLQFSAHLAARLFHARESRRPEDSVRLAMAIYEAVYVNRQAITAPEVLAALPVLSEDDPEAVAADMQGQAGRDGLAAAVTEAAAAGVFGAPFVRIGDQSFFGADRLPQITWHLQREAG